MSKKTNRTTNRKRKLPVLCCVCSRERTPFGWRQPKGPKTAVYSHAYCPSCYAETRATLSAILRFV